MRHRRSVRGAQLRFTTSALTARPTTPRLLPHRRRRREALHHWKDGEDVMFDEDLHPLRREFPRARTSA
ncbi:hypothetical protein ACRAWF_29000 [Streptomyces sp. L7]